MIGAAERHAVCCELVHEVACAAGEVSLKAAGASMIPVIWPRDLLTVRRCAFSNFRPGQVILYKRDGRLIAHRIQRINNGNIVTRGDALRDCDPAVAANDVVGIVEWIGRGERTFPPTLTSCTRMASYLLRRSDLLLRGTLFLGRRLRRSWEMQPSFTYSPEAHQAQR
jgi:hypothetical protein